MRARLYFAYGANMSAAAMARRCPGARALGAAILDHHRFAIIRRGHGTVRPCKGARVHGVLWRLRPGNAASLDRYEEVAARLYRREIRVVRRMGKAHRAMIYVAVSTAAGRPRAAYIGAIVAAARRNGFPADYVASLAAIARTSSGV